MARPKKEINWDVVQRLAEQGNSGVAIAAKFEIQSDTFYKRFKDEFGCSFQDYHAGAQEVGKADLRAMLWAKTMNNKAPGNSQLLLFMARCVLGMKEPELTNLVAANQTEIDKDHEIMRLKFTIAQMEEHANKS